MMTMKRKILVDARMASIWMRTAHQVEIPPNTIRQWAARRHIRNHGGLRRYDLREIEQHAREKGLIA